MLEAATFADIRPEIPTRSALLAEHDALDAQFAAARSYEDWERALLAWDRINRRNATWMPMVRLRFQQNTGDADAAAAGEALNALEPELADRDAAHKRALLASPHRAALEATYGVQIFALWACDVAAVDERILGALAEESQVEDAYVAELAGAALSYAGRTYTLSGIAAFSEDPDRAVREGATRAKWAWFEANSAKLDAQYAELVRLRTSMARTLGYETFVDLGYERMHRTDYDRADVARFRDAIVKHVVPLCARLAERQARSLGIERLMPWDLDVFDAQPSPRPPAGDALVEAGVRALHAIDPRLGAFARMMRERDLLDLPLRDGKAGGGFCTGFAEYGLPFVFANVNGTTHDVNVLVHELGHAYQQYSSREQPLADYLWPTYDAAEIDSMGMEFLVRPHLEEFFGDGAERYRRKHLAASLNLLAYGSAVDHFQHLIYERPEASPRERHAFWREMERRYLPWRVSGGIAHLESGGFWQHQRHIYKLPFYYIDYVLAMTCAMQIWTASLDDPADAFARYDALCARGGSLPFGGLVASAGLRSPFEPQTLRDIAKRGEADLFA